MRLAGRNIRSEVMRHRNPLKRNQVSHELGGNRVKLVQKKHSTSQLMLSNKRNNLLLASLMPRNRSRRVDSLGVQKCLWATWPLTNTIKALYKAYTVLLSLINSFLSSKSYGLHLLPTVVTYCGSIWASRVPAVSAAWTAQRV